MKFPASSGDPSIPLEGGKKKMRERTTSRRGLLKHKSLPRKKAREKRKNRRWEKGKMPVWKKKSLLEKKIRAGRRTLKKKEEFPRPISDRSPLFLPRKKDITNRRHLREQSLKWAPDQRTRRIVREKERISNAKWQALRLHLGRRREKSTKDRREKGRIHDKAANCNGKKEEMDVRCLKKISLKARAKQDQQSSKRKKEKGF